MPLNIKGTNKTAGPRENLSLLKNVHFVPGFHNMNVKLELTKILLLSETNMSDRRPIGDRHASSDSHRRRIYLIRDPNVWSETDMLDRSPIRNTYLTLDRLTKLALFLINYSYSLFR